MGTRIKNFDSTGNAPNGRLFAGDLNAIEDQYADQNNLGQTIGIGTLQIGEVGLQLIRYGASEARLSGAMRTDGILRGLGGLYAGAFTTTQRDAIPLANRPYGLVILNTTTNRLEINLSSTSTPSWQGIGGGAVARGVFGAMPAAGISNQNTFYFATDDNGGTLYYSDGSSWTKVAPGVSQQMVPLDNSVSTNKLQDGSVSLAKLGFDVATQAELDAAVAGRVISQATGIRVLGGSTVVSTDANGGFSVSFGGFFPSSIITVVAISGDPASGFWVDVTSMSNTSFSGIADLGNGNHKANSSIRVNWIAIGT